MQTRAYKTVCFGVVFATRSNKKHSDIVSKCRMVTLNGAWALSVNSVYHRRCKQVRLKLDREEVAVGIAVVAGVAEEIDELRLVYKA